MKKKQILAALLTAAMTMTLMTGCGNDSSTGSDAGGQNETSQESQGTSGADADSSADAGTGTDNSDAPTIVIFNNSGAFSVSGAEAGSDEDAYKEM